MRGVWTDKSVFTDAQTISDQITMKDSDNFIAQLSGMASTENITGLANDPADVMLILDLSSSMYPSKNPDTVKSMIEAVNESIEKLLALNEYNRVGVTIYYGGGSIVEQSEAAKSGKLMMPLARYRKGMTKDYPYMRPVISGGKLTGIATSKNLKLENGATVSNNHNVPDVAGTYAQKGILDAMEQFLREDIDISLGGTEHLPIFIFMSDGKPTAATENFTNAHNENATMGNNQERNRQGVQTDFVTQLTAAYAKKRVDERYITKTPQFYTLSLGTSISLEVMDPANHTTSDINKCWSQLVQNGSASFTTKYFSGWTGAPTESRNHTVNKTTDGFPSDVEQRKYVDQAFSAADANALDQVFEQIVKEVSLKSKYYPTLVEGNTNTSGNISFVDQIGEYMTVHDVKGIVLHDTYRSGEQFSQTVTNGSLMGTVTNPTEIGREITSAIIDEIGITAFSVGAQLIGAAYECGQLSYNTNTNEYSNYIGWYADENQNYLSHWNDKEEGTVPLGAKYQIKSYFYLGGVGEADGVDKTDLMYTEVWVRKEIDTGTETVIFSVPASLIPTVHYQIDLNKDGSCKSLSRTDTSPISLVYEVGLRSDINEQNIYEKVSEEYIEANNADGAISFYTNEWDRARSDGYSKTNTYSYFQPAKENSRYYFTVDTPLYVKDGDTYKEYKGDAQPSPDQDYYRPLTIYKKVDGEPTVVTEYRPVQDATLEMQGIYEKKADGIWYIKAGTVHNAAQRFVTEKEQNNTSTLDYSDKSFVDVGISENNPEGLFVVGATLGNNGHMTLIPDTGLKLTKSMAEGASAPDEAFEFTILDQSEADKTNGEISAIKVEANGTKIKTTVTFSEGQAKVELKGGESIYLMGLKANHSYKITETKVLDYIVSTITGDGKVDDDNSNVVDVTIEANQMKAVEFVNAERGTGNIVITKRVQHNLGDAPASLSEKEFTMKVKLTLGDFSFENAEFEAVRFGAVEKGDSLEAQGEKVTVALNEAGEFTITLKNGENIEIKGLPVGTQVTVEETGLDEHPGFSAVYYVDGQKVEAAGDAAATEAVNTIRENENAGITVVNVYEPEAATPVNVKIGGSKKLAINSGSIDEEYTFEFQLQYLEASSSDGNQWVNIGEPKSVTIDGSYQNDTELDFDLGVPFEGEYNQYKQVGTYYYRIVETLTEGNGNDIINDTRLHSFYVTVTDEDMDGQLEITNVSPSRDSVITVTPPTQDDENWIVDSEFENIYYEYGTGVTIEISKLVDNPSGSPLASLEGFRFQLKPEPNGQPLTSEATSISGFAKMGISYEKPGIYRYSLTELRDEGKAGWTFVEAPIEIVVTVTEEAEEVDPIAELEDEQNESDEAAEAAGDDEADIDDIEEQAAKVSKKYLKAKITADTKGQASIWAEVDENDTSKLAVSFKNTYKPTPVELPIDFVKKTISGRELRENEFEFQLIPVDSESTGGKAPMPKAEYAKNQTPGEDGKAAVDFGMITYDKVGTYFYQIKETSTNGNGVTTDKTGHAFYVTVTDGGAGALLAKVNITSTAASEIVFSNAYKAADAEYQISGNKTLENLNLRTGMFTFVLTPCNEQGESTGESALETKNDQDGSFAFSGLKYNKAGVYYYTLHEEKDKTLMETGKYEFSEVKYLIKVVVTDDTTEGKLKASHTSKIIGEEEEFSEQDLKFLNVYNQGNVEVVLGGKKNVTGMELEAGAFNFQLLPAKNDWSVAGAAIETVTNEADGSFSFKALPYTNDGIHYYLIKELKGSDSMMVYDESVFRVKVEIIYNEDSGKFEEPIITITDDKGAGKLEAAFVNHKMIPAKITLSGTKTLTGRDLKNGEFKFVLSETDDSFKELPNGISKEARNDADGKFTFEEITLSTDRQTHYFVMKEQIPEEAESLKYKGVTYDQTVYHATVNVSRDKNYQHKAEEIIIVKAGKTTAVSEVEFNNTIQLMEKLNYSLVEQRR